MLSLAGEKYPYKMIFFFFFIFSKKKIIYLFLGIRKDLPSRTRDLIRAFRWVHFELVNGLFPVLVLKLKYSGFIYIYISLGIEKHMYDMREGGVAVLGLILK
jgi:hypothetical protein